MTSPVDRLISQEIDTVEQPRAKSRNATVLRTPAQREYMESLAGQQGLTLAELNIRIGSDYGQTLDSITKTNASKVIDGLLKNLRSMR